MCLGSLVCGRGGSVHCSVREVLCRQLLPPVWGASCAEQGIELCGCQLLDVVRCGESD